MESVQYLYTFKTNEKVLDSLGDLLNTDYYAWDSQEMFRKPSNTQKTCPVRNTRHITMDNTSVPSACIPSVPHVLLVSALLHYSLVENINKPFSHDQCYPSHQHFNSCKCARFTPHSFWRPFFAFQTRSNAFRVLVNSARGRIELAPTVRLHLRPPHSSHISWNGPQKYLLSQDPENLRRTFHPLQTPYPKDLR